MRQTGGHFVPRQSTAELLDREVVSLPYRHRAAALVPTHRPYSPALSIIRTVRGKVKAAITSTAVSRTWTRLARFVAEEDGKVHYGQLVQEDLDIGLAIGRGDEVLAYEVRPDPFTGQVDKTVVLSIAQLLLPIARNTAPGAIRCVGINFKGHVVEAKLAMLTVPVMFMKDTNALAGPGRLVIPEFAREGEAHQLDFESELAVVLSREAKDVPEEASLDYVLGYVCLK